MRDAPRRTSRHLAPTNTRRNTIPGRAVHGHRAVGVSHDDPAAYPCDHAAVRETVLVVDDHAAFRAAARAMLETDGFEVVGEAETGADAVLAVGRLQPALVLLDVLLPDIDGFEVAETLAAQAEPPDVVLVSSREAITYGARIAGAPIRGFLPKADLSGAALRRLLG